MKRFAFIGCGKKKKRIPCQAGEMYQGILFKKTMAYCLQNFNPDSIFILSAKYGLLTRDTIINPYEETLNRKTRQEREAWGLMVKWQLNELGLVGEFWFFAGENYIEFFDGKFPMRGLSIGKRLQWLNQNTKKGVFGL